MKRALQHIVLIISVALLSGTLLAATPGAMLYATGEVNVNGNPVTHSTSVFEGDSIVSAPNSAATLSLNGASVQVNGNSSVIFGGQVIHMKAGGVTIKTTKGLAAKIGTVTAAPSAAAARFRFMRDGKSVNVYALEGDLTVLDGTRKISLSAGQSISLTCAECVNVDSKDDGVAGAKGKPNEDGSGTTEPAPIAVPTKHKISPNWLFGGANAIMSSAAAAAIAVTGRPVSPSVP